MSELETIGVFFCVICLTFFIGTIIYMIIDGDDDEKFESASISVIIIFILLFTIVISEYVGDERKIDEYEEKLSKYEEMEIEDEADN